ncbi:MAG: SRPBCC domain-containing protein [Pseudomonadota bacterium]
MQTLYYGITISAPAKIVWETMIDPNRYALWTKAFSPNSQFQGEWKQGAEMMFIDPAMGGTIARFEELKPYVIVDAVHIATLTKDLVQETTGEMTEKWVGSREIYRFNEKNSQTTLSIEMHTHKDFLDMFDKSWPQALEDLKTLVENQ